jgi:L-alanine-DL-glutamate epimerase-like enolase superfamily enzyme
VPILSGETVRVHELAEGMRRGDFDIARGDVHMKHGITGLHKAAGMADLLGYDLEIHAVVEPILDIANLHVACAIVNCHWSEAFNPLYQRGLQGDPLGIDADGFRHLPTGPGLGVEPDWNWIDDVTIGEIHTPR